jgi:hypothetical protein
MPPTFPEVKKTDDEAETVSPRVYDLKTPKDVQTFMKESKSHTEWNEKVEKIKAANNGNMPKFWKAAIIESGLGAEVSKSWYIP